MSLFTRRRPVPPATDAILVRIETLVDRQRELLAELRDELAEVNGEEGEGDDGA